jgi:hypothetical protein
MVPLGRPRPEFLRGLELDSVELRSLGCCPYLILDVRDHEKGDLSKKKVAAWLAGFFYRGIGPAERSKRLWAAHLIGFSPVRSNGVGRSS